MAAVAPFSLEAAQVLQSGEPVCVGRNPDSSVPLQSPEFPLLASRAHAQLFLRGSRLFIKDLKSTNGTFVHDLRVAGEQSIKDEAVISFGGPSKVISQGTLCPNPFCFKVTVQRAAQNARPHSVVIRALSAEARGLNQPKPQAVLHEQPRPEPADQLPQLDAVIDLTGAGDSRSPAANAVCALGPPLKSPRKRPTNAMAKPVPSKKHRLDDAVELVEETSPENDSKAQPAAEPLQQQPSASRGHLAAMEEQFECAVCKDWLVAPFSVHPCGHLLCGDCLRQWLEKSKTCPCCRANCSAPPVRAIAVENLIMQLVEPSLEPDELRLRKQHKAAWDKKSAAVVKRWQKELTPAAVPARPSAGHSSSIHRQAAAHWSSGLADFMNFSGGRWFAMGANPAPHPMDVPLQVARRTADPASSNQYKVEYTNTDGCRCQRCNRPIQPGALRIGVLQRVRNAGPCWRWYDPPCLPAELRHPARTMVHGIGSISRPDRVHVSTILHL